MSHTRVCRYFQRGECRNGDACPFSHVNAAADKVGRGDAVPIAKSMIPCKFFEDAKCNRGEKCRFSHGASAGSAAGTHLSGAMAVEQPSTKQDQNAPNLKSRTRTRTKKVAGAGAKAQIATCYLSIVSELAKTNKSNIFTEENYYLLQWLYRIRRAGCARGLRIGFLQPDFLWVIYRSMMRSKKLWRTDGDIKIAVDLWCTNRAEAEERYGHISNWDVSSVTDMSKLFYSKKTFNDDISRWDVSKVANMNLMFFNALAFNQPTGDWDVSNVTNMRGMFCSARSFNQAIGDWDVSNVTDTMGMFFAARSFNQPVGDWDMFKVTSMLSMFWNAESFNQPIGHWNVSKVTNMNRMFSAARAFNQDLTRWAMRSVRDTENMFRDADAMQIYNKPARLR